MSSLSLPLYIQTLNNQPTNQPTPAHLRLKPTSQQFMAYSQWLRGPLIGRGSTASISLATTIPTGTTFAVKSSELSRSAFLQREQRFLSSIDSPHVVSYMGFDLSLENGRTLFNLFLEYAPGGSISDRIDRNSSRGLKERDIRSYTRDILKGLSHLHSLGIAHCDVKGHNVLIAVHGSAKLADLGCARWVAGDDAGFSGTPQFMSPEVARGEEQGTPADIWALGCTFIEMATGRPPWPDIADPVSAVHHIGFSGESPEIPMCVSTEAREFLSNCLEKDPRERPTADELLHHPFITAADSDESSFSSNWRSPKCVLDQDIWESIHEEDEDEMELDGEEQGMSVATDDPSDRIQQLAAGAAWGIDRWLDERDWIDVRNGLVADRSSSTATSYQTLNCSLFSNYEDCISNSHVNCSVYRNETSFCCS